MEETYYGVRVSAHCRPKIHREHNNRTMSVVGAEKHIDHNGVMSSILCKLFLPILQIRQ